MLNHLYESQITKIWRYQLLDRTGMTTEDGEPVKMVYPGRINGDHGADFRDAVVNIGGKLIKGDVEIHVKSSDWQAHRHYQDEVYNRVVLHVVMWHIPETATRLQNGRSVPVLALHRYMNNAASNGNDESPLVTSGMPCARMIEHVGMDGAVGFLDSAGEERFLAKAAGFQADIARMGAGQSLYHGMMGALGYAKNKLPFQELARRVPLKRLEAMTEDETDDEEYLARQQALLLGMAGLLSSHRWRGGRENTGDGWVDRLEELWASSRRGEVMSSRAWHLSHVRPNNSPIRRIAAMSYLMLRYRERGVFEGMIDIMQEIPVDNGYRRLEEGLMVTSNGYWASHLDFVMTNRVKSPTLLGRGRAADIVVNVLLPFTFAWSQLVSLPGLGRKALAFYRNWPELASNTVERHMMEQLGIDDRLISSGCRQQGLIHIYETLCTQGRCHCCFLR